MNKLSSLVYKESAATKKAKAWGMKVLKNNAAMKKAAKQINAIGDKRITARVTKGR